MWYVKAVLVSFASGLSRPPLRTTSLICIPTSTGRMTSEAFIRVADFAGIIAEVGDLA